MRAVVVHESLYGNTRLLAEAVAAALCADYEVTVIRAADASAQMIASADLLVLGAPTHAHGLTRPSTRRGTVKRVVPAQVAKEPGMRELLASLPDGRGTAAAAFDTRLRGPRWLWGAASPQIAEHLCRAGFDLVLPPESFLVKFTSGPLVAGELERASVWGTEVARHARGPGFRRAA